MRAGGAPAAEAAFNGEGLLGEEEGGEEEGDDVLNDVRGEAFRGEPQRVDATILAKKLSA